MAVEAAAGLATVQELGRQWWLPRRAAGHAAQSTVARDGQVLNSLPAWFASLPVDRVTGDDVFRVAEEWGAGRGAAQATKARVVISLRALFRDLAEAGLVADNPASNVKRPKSGRPGRAGRPFAWSEVDRLVAAVGAFRADLGRVVFTLAHTGLRWGELVALQAGDLRDGGQALSVERSQSAGFAVKAPKSGRSRMVPLDRRVREVLAGLASGKGHDERLFSTPRGLALSRRNFIRDARWAELAPGHRIHDLRATWAVHLLDVEGVTSTDIQRWLGHGSLATTERYVNGLTASRRDAELRAALDRAA
ncbi:MAG: tyrosine-type recombinase/integrase [Bifidobacteriaceae bacterium]|jgi:integrase|nr:tyrosine-type recombinase/integrase [Bifidobacteriaceae bacterium]